MHCKKTQLLIDYDGYVVAFCTSIEGRTHENLTATYNDLFRRVVARDWVLTDTGFSTSYNIAGKPKYKTFGGKMYDRITRREQVLIENVNSYLKQCRSINKEDTFRHNESKLVACVIIGIGLYNMKRSWGYYATASSAPS